MELIPAIDLLVSLDFSLALMMIRTVYINLLIVYFYFLPTVIHVCGCVLLLQCDIISCIFCPIQGSSMDETLLVGCLEDFIFCLIKFESNLTEWWYSYLKISSFLSEHETRAVHIRTVRTSFKKQIVLSYYVSKCKLCVCVCV